MGPTRKRRCIFRGAKEKMHLSRLANADRHYSYGSHTKEKMHLSRREREYASFATRQCRHQESGAHVRMRMRKRIMFYKTEAYYYPCCFYDYYDDDYD